MDADAIVRKVRQMGRTDQLTYELVGMMADMEAHVRHLVRWQIVPAPAAWVRRWHYEDRERWIRAHPKRQPRRFNGRMRRLAR